jgi:hypothetical protein
MWSKYFGMTIEQKTNWVKKEKECHIAWSGTVDELKFEFTIVCAKQVSQFISLLCNYF